MAGPHSPPKRVTRARAAAKVTDPATRTTQVMTAAAKAKAVRSTATGPTASSSTRSLKRKSPSDEEDSDHDGGRDRKQVMLSSSTGKPTARGRGRPKKADTEPQPPVLSTSTRTRGRPKKTEEPAIEETAPARPIKATRAKKTATDAITEPAKTTRTRPTTTATAGTASTTAKATGKPAVKKTVKFEEPEKENIAPAAPSRGSIKASKPAATAGGLRGRPVRKAAGAAGRTTRTAKAGTTEKEDKQMPLSPKKINQLSMNRSVESDDELAMDEKVPVRRFKKAPIKAAIGASKALKTSIDQKSVSVAVETDENAPVISAPEPNLSLMLGTPAKRLPASPWKGSIASPAKRVEGLFSAQIAQKREQEEGQAPQSALKAGLLQTPAKRQPLSIPISFGVTSATQSSASPFKFSLLSSPAKRSIMSPIKSSLPPPIEEEEEPRSPAPKPTLLASPLPPVTETADENANVAAEAPAEEVDDTMMIVEEEDGDVEMPESPSRPRFPGRLSAVLPRDADPTAPDNMMVVEEEEAEQDIEDDSAETTIEEIEVEAADAEGDRMVLDLDSIEVKFDESPAKSPAQPTPRPANPVFGLREDVLNSYGEDTDSDEEATRQFTFTAGPETPLATSFNTPGTRNGPRRTSARFAAKKLQATRGHGFTPLADQLGQWTAGLSPLKTGISASSPSPPPAETITAEEIPTPGAEVAQTNFFEEEMLARPEAMEIEQDIEDEIEEKEAPMFQNEEIETPVEDVSFTEEDVALAAEANEMSLMEPEKVEVLNTSVSSHEDTMSEASQEYGDENAAPVEPNFVPNIMEQAPALPPVTPARVLRRREVHTVKVPLKPADESTPKAKTRKRHSTSNLPASRPTQGTARNATVISYEPTKGGQENSVPEIREEDESGNSLPPITPDKADIWQKLGTPARSPHRHLSSTLLRGAVVYVDVYTSEGADASSLFVELLNQMGARCIKDWKWNPESSDSKIGITHVVYKDGGKRTLEKVRQSRGVVQCVGVSWVLDCERENEWLPEDAYYVDTSCVPRGGARRRKSMEPRAMANMNGTMVPISTANNNNSSSSGSSNTTTNNNNNNNNKSSSSGNSDNSSSTSNASSTSNSSSSSSSSRRHSTQAPSTPPKNDSRRRSGRRASSLWVRTPERPENSSPKKTGGDPDSPKEDDEEDTEWGQVLLPVPKTPAPEAIARYAANISPGPDTPESSVADDEDEETKRQQMLMRTCPPKKTATFAELGERVLGKEKDERVLMRLMAARRKSLQFAPKIGSPLARSWR
ncbi:hypothetical protein QBC38DRAFT_498357 [Podospora fimiseda]|uniref:BRCT domain-containing protein n=1 Tax=Podospora fimiseda TaxID=252190 RepID=A0AAN7H3X5_9PEZI|nr:hypothetical protein QBC38DRAFT_498357 [Podospora fimiseda]